MSKQLDFDSADLDLSNASDDVLDKYAVFLARRDEREEERSRIIAAHKTVATFSGLIGRRLHLKPAKMAYTDGVEIAAPFDHPYMYEMVEHEISHNLFKSSFEAKTQFCDQYVLQVAKALSAFGTQMGEGDRQSLAGMVGMILNVIEDHRVNSLWAKLYPGSYKRLHEYGQTLVKRKLKHAHDDVISYFLCIAYAVKVPPGQYDRFEPAMVTALKKVEDKGPGATFVVGKWLMTQIVSEIIRIQKQMPPPPKAGSSTVKTDIDDMGDTVLHARPSGDSGDDGDDGDGDEDGDGGSADGNGAGSGDGADDADDGADDANGADSNGQGTPGANGASNDKADAPSVDPEWTPPPLAATAEERVDAFKKMLDAAKQAAVSKPFAGAHDRVNNGRPSARGASELNDARQQVAAAYNTDVTNDQALKDYLTKSAADMEQVVEQIRDALESERKQTEKDWCGRNVTGRLKFKDVKKATYNPTPLTPDERRTVGRMREIFQRVKARSTKILADDGVDIDIPALIQRKVSDHPLPFFKADVTGRGFKALVLVDRSSSMDGPRSIATERATRILRAALKQPNVSFNVWGFHGAGDGCVLTRVAPNIDIADSAEMPACGNTPMVDAVRAAVNFLTDGTEKKQLIILTDGEPNHSSNPLENGKNRFTEVRREVQRARKLGINVTTLVIGSSVERDTANLMFGDGRQWVRVDDGHKSAALTQALVKVVSTSFSRYLQNG